jgi:hypothetical protein
MSIRKHDNSVKSGRGISGAKGETFTKDYAQDPWTIKNPGGDERRYNRNDGSSAGDKFIERGPQNLLRQGEDFMFSAGTRDLWDDVAREDGLGPHGGLSDALDVGVNRPQSQGTKRSRR